MNLVSSIQQCTSPITTRALVDHTLFSTELSSRSSHRNGPTMVRMWGRARSPNCSTRSLRWSRRTVFKYSCWTETSPALSHQCVGLFVVCLFVCLFVCCLLFVCLLFVCLFVFASFIVVIIAFLPGFSHICTAELYLGREGWGRVRAKGSFASPLPPIPFCRILPPTLKCTSLCAYTSWII